MTQAQHAIEPATRENMLAGVNALADVVAATLGPPERKQELTGGADIGLQDAQQFAAARFVLGIASRTADVAGDGTTTTAILTRRMYAEGHRALAEGHDPTSLKRGIDKAVEAAATSLKSMSRRLTEPGEIGRVAAKAAGVDPATEAIAVQALAQVGTHGAITVGESRGPDTVLEQVRGLRVESGYLSHYFMTDPDRMEAVLEDPVMLLCDDELSGADPLVPLLTTLGKAGHSVLIVARDFRGEALGLVMASKLAGILRVCPIIAPPGVGPQCTAILEDIATLTGGKVVSASALPDVSSSVLGRARRVIASSYETTIVDGRGAAAAVAARIAAIKKGILNARSDYDREKMQERQVNLSGGVAVIHPGASDREPLETKRAVEDMLLAVDAIRDEGVVPGGGVALLRLAATLDTLACSDDERHGVDMVCAALEEPCRWIAANAGLDGAEVVRTIKGTRDGIGLNAATGRFEDLMQAGIADVTKAVRWALGSAAAAAWILLTDEKTVQGHAKT